MIIKIMELYYEDGYSIKRISELIKINESFVKSVLGL